MCKENRGVLRSPCNAYTTRVVLAKSGSYSPRRAGTLFYEGGGQRRRRERYAEGREGVQEGMPPAD